MSFPQAKSKSLNSSPVLLNLKHPEPYFTFLQKSSSNSNSGSPSYKAQDPLKESVFVFFLDGTRQQ